MMRWPRVVASFHSNPMSDDEMVVLKQQLASFHSNSMSDNGVRLGTFSLPSDAMSDAQLSLE